MMNLQLVGVAPKELSDNEGTADFGDEPKSMVVSESHSANALYPMLVTDGRDTDVSESQL
jgi:hypothetical protein